MNANDPELLELPLHLMDLPRSITKALRSHSVKTIGDLLALRPSRLVSFGLGLRDLREIAVAAQEMTLQWPYAEEIDSVEAHDEPVRPGLRKSLLDRERETFVLEGWSSSRGASDHRCPVCGDALTRVAWLDLSAYQGAGLPEASLFVGRCHRSSCMSVHDWRPPGSLVLLGPAGRGERPKARREYDYPEPDPKQSSDRHDAVYLDHKWDTIGPHPRVGGYPNWELPAHELPHCGTCGELMVLAFEQHRWSPGQDDRPFASRAVEDVEHAFVCAAGCHSGVLFLTR